MADKTSTSTSPKTSAPDVTSWTPAGRNVRYLAEGVPPGLGEKRVSMTSG